MRSRRTLRRALVSASLALTTVVVSLSLFADPAPAATSNSSHSTTSTAPVSGVVAARAQLAAAIVVRQTALRRVLASAAASKTIVPADQSVLTALLTQALAGMNALAVKVPTDTTVAEVAADQTDMVRSYRVLALQVPAGDMVLAADLAAAIEADLTARLPALQALVANQVSPVPASIKTAFTDFQRELTAAQSATGGVSSSLLALLPGSYPGNQSVLASARSDLANVRRDLGLAVTDLNAIVTNVHH